MSLNSLTPVLPTELERQIFELMCAFTPGEDPKTHIGRMARERVGGAAALSHHHNHSNPPSKRIKDYPYFNEEILSTVLLSKPAAFFHNSVRNLLLHALPNDFVKYVLSICTGVESLWEKIKGWRSVDRYEIHFLGSISIPCIPENTLVHSTYPTPNIFGYKQ
ncbi:hypothetical protein B0H13DRAFT_1141174 [Mycena leptocephala]|nr:hypothetical protein B0H13DRAFT_1141174 [Mycena leptocephala]